MSIIYNGTTLGSVKYGSTTLDKVIYNGTEVFTAAPVDPTKTSFTEAEFILICQYNLQSKMKLGAKITLSNTYCSTYEVIDTNHDSTTNTVDIMPTTQVGDMSFSLSSNNTYSSSSIRTWINGTYFNAFSNAIQSLSKTMSIKVATSLTGGETLNDKVKLLSTVEMNYTSFDQYMPGYSTYKEGNPYPIFTAGAYNTNIADRWRGAGSYGNSSYYWLRSRCTDNANGVWRVHSGGSGSDISGYGYTRGVLPVLRF